MTKVSNLNLYGNETDTTKRLNLFANTTSQKITANNDLDVVATGAITIETKGQLVFKTLDADGNAVAASTITDVVTEISTARVVNSTNLTAINAEATARASAVLSADTSLTSRVSTEESTRASAVLSADTSLTTRLTAEESARASAVTAEAAARTNADTTLTNNLTAEQSAREDADTSLTTKLNKVSASVSVVLLNADANYDTLAEIANAFEQADTGVLATITSLGVKLDALSTTLSTLTA